MYHSVICCKNKLGINIFLIAMILYGNSSCLKSKKSTSFGGIKGDAVHSSIGREAVNASEIMGSDKTVLGNQDLEVTVTASLLSHDSWLMRKGSEKFKRRFCKLICGYLIDLIEGSSCPNLEPLISLESLHQFLVSRGVQLKMRKVTIPDDINKTSIGTTGAVLYVVDDIIVGQGGQFVQNFGKDVFLIKFKGVVDNEKKDDLGNLRALCQLFGAMSRNEVYGILQGAQPIEWHLREDVFREYFRPMLDRVHELDLTNVMGDIRNNFESWVREFTNGGDSDSCQIDGSLFERFVSLVKANFVADVVRYVHRDLFRLLDDVLFDCSDGKMPVFDDRDELLDGLFAGALVRMPFNRNENKIDTLLNMGSVGWPRIFFIKEANCIHALGTIVRGKDKCGSPSKNKLKLSGCCTCALKMCNNCSSNSSGTGRCNGCLGLSTLGFSLRARNTDRKDLLDYRDQSFYVDVVPDAKTRGLGETAMDEICGDHWRRDDQRNKNFKLFALSYGDSVRYFYKDLLLVCLKRLEASL